MSLAAYNGLLEFTGDAVAVVDEPTTALDTVTFQITSQARQVLDPDVPVTVEADGSPVASGDFLVDHLFGIVTLASAPVDDTSVTVSGSYLPRGKIGCLRSVSISVERDELDVTCIDPSTEARDRIMGLRSASADVDYLEALPLFSEYTINGVTVTVNDILNSEDSLLISYRPAPDQAVFRAFVRMTSHEGSAELEGLVESSFSLVSTLRNGVSYAWGTE